VRAYSGLDTWVEAIKEMGGTMGSKLGGTLADERNISHLTATLGHSGRLEKQLTAILEQQGHSGR